MIQDYNNKPVLSGYTPVQIGDFQWALLAEIDVAEALRPVDEQGEAFFKKYKEEYGYYDLFLINPDGYVFYTVAQEADYQTNILNGPYQSSSLGKLTANVIKSKSYGIGDFAPYAPSNNEPAAFIAKPLIDNGNVEMIIALQLSLESINNIMMERKGMGESGETYLVGSDSLMRSDSFLDPVNHSVVASFANPQLGKIDTETSRKALKGESGHEIVNDYNGNPVLSAYAPLSLEGVNWAILADIDKAEAFASLGFYDSYDNALGIFG
ncbi:cache domain-containing protein, partial [bacterium]|nr:cache domain-containing protein [bacterium]